MAFIGRLRTEYAVAGGVFDTPVQDRAQFSRPATTFDVRNIYLKGRLPRYSGALRSRGDCAGHAGIADGDTVLYDHRIGPKDLAQDNVIVARAKYAYPGIEFEDSWKCLRVFKSFDQNNDMIVTSLGIDNAEENQTLPIESYIGKGVFAFTI